MRFSLLDRDKNRFYTRPNRRPRRSGSYHRIVGALFSLLAFGFITIGCSLDPVPEATPGSFLQETKQFGPGPPATPTSTPQMNSTALPTQKPLTCLSLNGRIELHELAHPAFVSPIRLRVYVPPCYDEDNYATYPTLILLHGLHGTDAQWDELGVNERADQLIQSGQAPPFIVLMPWIRNSQVPYTAVTEAVIPFALDEYRLSTNPRFWAIGGISRGGGQALQIGLRGSQNFGTIGLHSPAILHAPELVLSWYLAIEPDLRPLVWIDIGESDSLRESTFDLIKIFKEAGIHTSARINPGEHTVEYWVTHLEMYLDWYVSHWLP